jgi:hypothetical protein
MRIPEEGTDGETAVARLTKGRQDGGGARGPAPLYMLPASIQPFSAQHFPHMGVDDFLS